MKPDYTYILLKCTTNVLFKMCNKSDVQNVQQMYRNSCNILMSSSAMINNLPSFPLYPEIPFIPSHFFTVPPLTPQYPVVKWKKITYVSWKFFFEKVQRLTPKKIGVAEEKLHEDFSGTTLPVNLPFKRSLTVEKHIIYHRARAIRQILIAHRILISV